MQEAWKLFKMMQQAYEELEGTKMVCEGYSVPSLLLLLSKSWGAFESRDHGNAMQLCNMSGCSICWQTSQGAQYESSL